MRHLGLVVLLAALAALAACKRRDPDRFLGTQEEANQRYLHGRLGRGCDGRKFPSAKPYRKGAGPHQLTRCTTYLGGEERWLCGHRDTEKLRSLEEAELLLCVEFDSPNSVRSANVRVVAAATGEEVAKVTVDLSRSTYSGFKAQDATIDEAVKPLLDSMLNVVDTMVVRGTQAREGAAPDLVIEIPHGATRTDDFTSLARLLRSPLPPSLVDFFHVNTDAGAPELAEAVAAALALAEPARAVTILRCRIPRTFIDCNRRVDASPEEFKAGKVTPGLMPWITDAEDRALLRGRYDAYVAAVRAAVAGLAPDGALLLLHSYAPRTVDVEVDLQIVESLHRAYLPDVEPTWPLRPELDVIGRGTDGTSHAPAAVVEALREGLAPLGLTVADSATYPLHPSTLAWEHVTRLPGRALCLEVRRDLLADPFDPFVEMRIGAAKVARLAGPLATALRRWWPRR